MYENTGRMKRDYVTIREHKIVYKIHFQKKKVMKNLVYILTLLIFSAFSYFMGNLNTTELDEMEVTEVAKEKGVIKQVSVSNDNLLSTEESTDQILESGEDFNNLLIEVTVYGKKVPVLQMPSESKTYANLKATPLNKSKSLKSTDTDKYSLQKMPEPDSRAVMRELSSIKEIDFSHIIIPVVGDNIVIQGIPNNILARGRSPS